LLPVLLSLWWFGRLLQRKLGGYTGDCLGAMQQISEMLFYLGVLACISH
jgi:adenosylcobinamide-GDP ribazoletransferase